MGYKVVVIGGPGKDTKYREYVMDSESDKANLPGLTANSNGEISAPGSVAYTADMAHSYVLSPSGSWTEVS